MKIAGCKCDSVSNEEKDVKVHSGKVDGGCPVQFNGRSLSGKERKVSKNKSPSEKLYALKTKVLEKQEIKKE